MNIEHSTRNDELRSCFLDNLGLKALMGFTTYILVNEMRSHSYVGQTKNLKERLKLHNGGKVNSTKQKGPWVILYFEDYGTRGEAMARERWFKTRVGRKENH